MSEAFEFATAGRIIFGAGRLDEVGAVAREFGRRVLMVTGSNSSRAAPVSERLIKSGCEVESIAVAGEPTRLPSG